MKKFTFLLAVFTLSGGILFGQTTDVIRQNGALLKSSHKADINWLNDKSTIDTCGLSNNFEPQFGVPNMVLQTFYMVDGLGNKTGYWFGTGDTVDETDKWAQCWGNTGSVYISGILFFAGGKTQLSSGTGSDLLVGIQEMHPYTTGVNGCVIAPPMTFAASPANPYLAQATINIADIDTNFLVFNYVPFPSMVYVTGEFCAIADFTDVRVAGDTAYLFSDQEPDGMQLNYTMYYLTSYSNYFWMSTYFSGANPDLDNNMAIFAVIDNGAGVEDANFFEGIKMSLRHDQAAGKIYVDYVLEYGSPVILNIYDIDGREVFSISEGDKTAGCIYTISVDSGPFKPGLYLFSLLSKSGRFTKKSVIE